MVTIEYLGNNRVNIVSSGKDLLKVLDFFESQLVYPSNPANSIGDDKFSVTIFSDDHFPDPDPFEILAKANLL